MGIWGEWHVSCGVISKSKPCPAVEIIRNSGDHLLGLINDILDLSKIEAGREELHPNHFDLANFAQGLAAMFRLRCEQKDLQWQEDFAFAPQRVFVDEGKLRQVLVNLLGNAAKFTERGHVRLQIAAGEGRRFRFAVEDSGPGIDPEHQAAVFDPFHQDTEGLARGGTGLGLTIARRHVELLGGELGLDAQPGRGALPSIALPQALYDQIKEALRIRNVTTLDHLFDEIEALSADAGALAERLCELNQHYDLQAIAELIEENAPD